jgi:hypothetical protein
VESVNGGRKLTPFRRASSTRGQFSRVADICRSSCLKCPLGNLSRRRRHHAAPGRRSRRTPPAQCETPGPKPDRRRVTGEGAALDLEHPCGSRIRREDEKNRLRHFDENSANRQVKALSFATENGKLMAPLWWSCKRIDYIHECDSRSLRSYPPVISRSDIAFLLEIAPVHPACIGQSIRGLLPVRSKPGDAFTRGAVRRYEGLIPSVWWSCKRIVYVHESDSIGPRSYRPVGSRVAVRATGVCSRRRVRRGQVGCAR